MPNRIIRENILTSEPVCSLGWPEEVFYRRLMSIVDDYGRVEANHQLLRARCYPLQTDHVRVADITRWMAACQKSGLVVLYEVAGKAYLQIEKFGQQQRSASKCPAPPASDISCDQVSADAHLVVFVSGDVVEDVHTSPPAPAAARPPACPFEEIVALYHEHLPMLPSVAVLSDGRKRTVGARWREVCSSEQFDREKGLEWFAWFFGHAAKSRFLTGRAPGNDWRADFDFLMTQSKFAKVIEGSYHKDAA